MQNYFSANKVFFYVIGVFTFLVLFYFLFLSAPTNSQFPIVIRIEKGNSLRNVSLLLKQEHIIRSRIVFEAFVITYGGEKHINYSDYLFENKLGVIEVARRISKGEHHMPPIAVTIPEGFDVTQIGEVFASKLLNFNKDKFLSIVKEKEGYLFPDTYFFLSTDNEQDVFQSISKNFEKKILSLRTDIISSGKSEKEIIIMASIIEREAKGDTDREFISGILWKRLKIGMPLQVDAALVTYKTKGLPKSPIGNPGLLALKAALYPQNSHYLYYLHDKSGLIHYAKSFSEHKQNILKYLK